MGSDPDAGDLNARLDILDPPGDAIGLTHGGRVTLRVRYADERGEAIAGAAIKFAMTPGGAGENPAGSVLSSDTAVTDAQGVARVDLVAGAQDTSFRVSVDARDAPTQYFYVTVSAGGFVKLYITPVHQGWRAVESFSRIEVRLYRAEVVTCAELDIDAPPASLSPPRSLSDFGGTVDYLNVTARQPHTLVAWAHARVDAGGDPGSAESAAPVSAGCVDLGASELPASRVQVELAVRDRPLRLDRAPVRSMFDLTPVAAAIDAATPGRPWDVLACDAGPGQLVLDCTLDALAPDAALDCVVTGTSALIQAVNTRRGPVDANGCRPEVLADASPSADAELTLAMAAGFPTGAELAAMLADRAAIAAGFELDSELTVFDARTAEETAASHRLTVLRAVAPGGEVELPLAATSRPVIESLAPAVLGGDALALGEHGFTLRPGDFARRAFATIALAPRGLEADQHSLGTALARAAAGSGQTGCQVLSELICADIGHSVDCLAAACVQGASALDEHLSAWWRAVDATGIDFVLAGTAQVHDHEGDLVVDAIGRDAQGQSTGAWSATLHLDDGTTAIVNGSP